MDQKQTRDIENKLVVAKLLGAGVVRITYIYIKMGKQQSPTVQHRELC